MSNQHPFPWGTLKAETLRSIVHDLGIPAARSLRKREGMVNVLIAVAENGLEKTIEEYQEIANKEHDEEKDAGQSKARTPRSNGAGPTRSTRQSVRSTRTFEGVVLPSGTRRMRRPSAKARS